jgi:hypothetical protein
MPTSSTGLHHRHFTAYPGVHLLYRPAWTIIFGLLLLEEVQHMLRAISRPYRKQVMISVL